MYTIITECRRSVLCSYCNKEILLHSPMIKGSYYTSADKGTKFMHTLHWHVERGEDQKCCWLEQGLAVLKERKLSQEETRGNRMLLLPVEKRKQRLQLLQKHARLVQMLKEEIEKLATDSETTNPKGSWQRVALLGERIEELKSLIAPLGGIPVTWLAEGETSKSKGIEEVDMLDGVMPLSGQGVSVNSLQLVAIG